MRRVKGGRYQGNGGREGLRTHTHLAIHDQGDCIFDTSLIGMLLWNVQV